MSGSVPPDFVPPMLAEPGPLPDATGQWAAELKWDGMRLITAVRLDGTVRCWSRNGREVTAGWPELTGAGALPAALAGRSAVLDGEVVAFDPNGRPSFERLQRRMQVEDPLRARSLVRDVSAVYLAFDLLDLDGRSLQPASYRERRGRLEELELSGPAWQVPAAHPDPAALFALSTQRGLEGVVCKLLSSPYRPGRRSGEWRKIKNVRSQEVVLVGWKPGRGSRAGGLGSLLLALPGPDGRLRYCGHVGTGMSGATRAALLARLGPLARPDPPLDGSITRAEATGAHWVEPILVGEVAFTEWTADGRLRHPSWRGLRPDKTAAEVVRE